jgi:hypothetical protein
VHPWTRKLTDKCEKTYPYKVLGKLLETDMAELNSANYAAEINNLPNRLRGETIAQENLERVLRDVSS